MTDPKRIDLAPPPYVMEFCSCPEGPYHGAQKMGTPPRCERCGFLPDEPWVLTAMLDALTRHGVLTEETRVGLFILGRIRQYSTEEWADKVIAEERARTDGVDIEKVPEHRFVTGWEASA